MPKLTGVTMIRNGVKYDYCFQECIDSLSEFCDEVIVCDAGSTDGTTELLRKMENPHTKVIYRSAEDWEAKKHLKFGMLAHFSNIAIEQVQSDWFFYQQADEILTERSYVEVDAALSLAYSRPKLDGFVVSRINLWGSPATMLNVQGARKPCSTEIVRLARRGRWAVGDAESIGCEQASLNFLNQIRLYHFGYVRRKEVHCAKIREMEGNIFQCGIDPKLENMDIFDPGAWFGPEDLVPVPEPLPRIMQQWALDRM